MLEFLSKDKNLLNNLIKIAQKQSKSNKVSDVFTELIKIAQSDFLSKPQSQIIDELSGFGDYEKKKNALRRILENNLSLFSMHLLQKANTDEIRDALVQFMPNKFVDYAVDTYLAKYNGRNAFDFNLEKFLNGTLKTATEFSKLQALKKTKIDRSTTEMPKDIKGQQVDVKDTGALNAIEMIESGTTEESDSKTLALEKIFSQVLNDPRQDILSFYVLNDFIPTFKNIKSKVDSSVGREAVDAELELDKFYEGVLKFIKSNIKDPKRIYEQRGQKREFTLQDVQNEVDTAAEAMNLDQIVDKILESPYYKLPKFTKNFDPILVKETIKALVKSVVIMNTKSRLSVPFAQYTIGAQGGRRPVSQIEVVHRLIEKGLSNLIKDPEALKEVSRKALMLLGSSVDETGAITHKKKDYTDYALFQHVTPMIISGLMKNAEDEMGVDFARMTPEQQQEVKDKIHRTIFPYLPHAYKEPGKPAFVRQEYTDDLEQATKEYILERLQRAGKFKRDVFN